MRSSRARALVAAALGLLGLGAAPPAGVLFYASFDGGPSADLSVGRPEPFAAEARDPLTGLAEAERVPGVFGKAITRVAGSFHALGNVQAERGTLAFFARLRGPERGIDPLQVRTIDPYYWDTYLRASGYGDGLAAWIPDEGFKMDVSLAVPGQRLSSERWRHLAIAWDQAYGAVFYLDGERVASSWGERSWVSRGVDPAELALAWADGGIAYDELYVFDRALDDAQVRALARHNRIPRARDLPPIAFDARRSANRRRELGWEDTASLSRIPLAGAGAKPTVFRQVIPSDARALHAEAGAVFDGRLGGGWPPLFNYEYERGGGLSVELPEPCDLVVLEGRFRGRVHAGRSSSPPAEAPLHAFGPERYVTRWRPRAAPPGWLSFFRSGDDFERQIAELSFFRSTGELPGASRTQRWFLGSSESGSGNAGSLGLELRARYAEGDRAQIAASSAPTARGSAGLSALRFHHVILPARSSAWGLRGLRLRLALRGDLDELPLRLELRDPLRPGRRLAALDVALAAPGKPHAGRVDLAVDLVGRAIPAERPLWLVLAFGRDVELETGGDDGSRVELLEAPLAAVAPGFVERELPIVRSAFRRLSEARPWVWHEAPERELVAFNLRARELFEPLSHLRSLAPDEPRISALWSWTHKFARSPPTALQPQPVAGHTGAPAWALWQRELRSRGAAVVQWWIDHRQAPNGEFGDDWNDDTDFIQNVPALAMISDPGDRLRASARAVADGVYAAGRMRGGLNTRSMDPLHAYEEGMNAQQVMALLQPGDPRYLERLMESARAVEEKLMVPYAPGRRAFRTNRFSADRVEGGAFAQDSVNHSVLLAPALSVAYYNRNERATHAVAEWVDGWLDAYPRLPPPVRGQGPLFASTRRPDGQVTDRDWLPRALGYVSLFPALYSLTGESRYREVTRYWNGSYSSGFLEAVSDIQYALELLPIEQHRVALLRWSRSAPLERLSDDELGPNARRRLLEAEITGEIGPALEALQAAVRNLRALEQAYTWAEPINDRIWLPTAPLAVMAQGGLSHQRNQLWPQHHVSYSGFSDLAAWVRQKSEGRLRIWLYSFAHAPEQGSLRLWRAAGGRYRLRVGPDADADGAPERATPRELRLGRLSELPLRLEPGVLVALDLELQGQPESPAKLPDLALSIEAGWTERRELALSLHNLGSAPARGAVVRIVDAAGRRLAEQIVGSIDAPLDLRPRRTQVRFPGLTGAPGMRALVDPEQVIPELNETNNSAP